MKFFAFAPIAISCVALVACGGNKNAAPATDPTPAPAPAAPAPEKKISLDSTIDRYSYALGMVLGRDVANINVPLKMDLVMAAIQDENLIGALYEPR